MNVELLTAKDAAILLGLHEQTVYQLAAQGELPSVKIGWARRFPVEALRAWIRERTTGTGAPLGEP